MRSEMPQGLQSANRNTLAVGGICLAVVFFLALNVWSNATLKNARFDLTQDRLYTISQGTLEVLALIDEPVTLRYYRSAVTQDLGAHFTVHAKRAEELLDDYARRAEGRLIVERYDPQPFSPEEDLAVADGLQGVALGLDGSQLYFGLAGTNSTDDRQAIPYLAPERGPFLEYDLTRLIHDLANPDKTVVALLGDLPIGGTQLNGFRPWLIMDAWQQFVTLRTLPGSLDRIEEDVDVLILAQPAGLDPKTLYAIDQFVMGGGRVLAFVDPFAEVLVASRPGAPLSQEGAIEALEPLFAAWGVRIPAGQVVGDRLGAVRVQARHQGRQVVTDYLPWLDLTAANFAADDVMLSGLQQINLRSTGSIHARDGATTAIEPMIRSSAEAMEIDVAEISMMPDPVGLLNSFEPVGTPFTLAARVTGPVKSAFPDGPPEEVESEELRAAHRGEAAQPLSLILIADADLLADSTWVRRQQLLGQSIALPFASNGDLAVNAVDVLTGSQSLIGLRGRGLRPRPFEVIEAMTREAEDKFRASEQVLLEKITATQEEIRKLQQDEQEGGVILTSAQQETIETFREEMLDLRQELRDVQYALHKDADTLAFWIKAINIWLVPILVAFLAIVLASLRKRRASGHHARATG